MSTELATLLDRINMVAGPTGDRMVAATSILQAESAGLLEIEALIPELSSAIQGGKQAVHARRAAGAFYTPTSLVEFMLTRTLEPWQYDNASRLPVILDPSCGTGRFLLAAGERLVTAHVSSTGVSSTDAWQLIGPQLLGFDSDPLATAWLRGRITMLAGGEPTAAAGIRTCNAFDESALPSAEVDIVLGNPPFGTPLRKLGDAELLRKKCAAITGSPLGPYADLAAVFLLLASHALRDRGRLSLVQPLSVLASRDTQLIRADLASRCTTVFAWASSVPVFDADVYTCVLGVHVGVSASKPTISRWANLPARALAPTPPPPSAASWSTLVSAALDVPDPPAIETNGTIGDFADATADFRDQFYGLKGAIVECPGDLPPGHVPVVTSGVLDVAECAWGVRTIRLLGEKWTRPAIRLGAMSDAMQEWATSRLTAKVMLPTQTRILEPVLDEQGRWLPSVPIVSVTAPPQDLAHIAAVLASPLMSLIALHRHLGTARHPQAIKLAARDVLALPMPSHAAFLHNAAAEFRLAQHASTGAERVQHLQLSGECVHDAFGLSTTDADAVFAWWTSRAPARTASTQVERPVHT